MKGSVCLELSRQNTFGYSPVLALPRSKGCSVKCLLTEEEEGAKVSHGHVNGEDSFARTLFLIIYVYIRLLTPF